MSLKGVQLISVRNVNMLILIVLFNEVWTVPDYTNEKSKTRKL